MVRCLFFLLKIAGYSNFVAAFGARKAAKSHSIFDRHRSLLCCRNFGDIRQDFDEVDETRYRSIFSRPPLALSSAVAHLLTFTIGRRILAVTYL